MERDLNKFYENVTYESKDKAVYADDKGNRMILNPLGLYLTVQLKQVEATEKNLQVLRFEGEVEKDEEPGTENVLTYKPDEKDNTLVKQVEVEVYNLWIASNGLGIKKAFLDKKDALNFYDKVKQEIDNLK